MRSSFFSRHLLSLCHAALILCLLSFSGMQFAHADELADARVLVRSGKLGEALNVADNYLAKNPNDAHMLFLKGLILTQQDQNAKAISVFTKLTESYPALPEPYNNLAVLYASAGQYDKARSALEMAIRTNPSYATAYENLGDVYAKLASQAYDKALKTNASNTSAKTKLAMVYGLIAATPGEKVPPAVVIAAAPAPKPEVTPPVVSAPAAPPARAEPKPISKPEPKPAAKPEPKPASKSATNGNRDNEDIARMLDDWAAAWSSKDVKKYLSYYASDFKTPKGVSRKAWAEERKSRIVGKGRISVKVGSPKITVSGNTATAKFRQAYSSNRFSTSSNKTMSLTKSGGKWKIRQEQAH